MTFIQNQVIMMHENMGYNTELIANYCYKGLSHNALGSTGVNLFPSCSQHYCALVNFVVRTGQILTMVLVHHFGLKYVRDTHLSETHICQRQKLCFVSNFR